MVVADNPAREKEEPCFSDPEDFEDKFDEDEYLGEHLAKKPDINEYEKCCVVVFNIPVVGEDRFPKLKNVLTKIFTATCKEYNDEYPLDAEGKTKGFCFLELKNRELAEHSAALLDGHVLDKKHVFKATVFADIIHMAQPDENFEPPQKREYVDNGDLWWWLQNEKCHDQFAVQYLNDMGQPLVAVETYQHGAEPQRFSDRIGWTVFQWSPSGTYLATIHGQGVIIWGGKKFEKIQRFPHEGVQYLDFSPNEKYLVTHAPSNQRWVKNDDDSLRIFDVITGEMVKGFSLQALTGSHRINVWPLLKWSYDEKYFALMKPGGNGICVHDLDTFQLNNKKSMTHRIPVVAFAQPDRLLLRRTS
ncbi:hypothetical protein L596_002409 [Steinernema carpocapsae]|uniref:RRM domain-containing protein n=1 Tax=Steinernema carpocapsae TaxID=34508 RepID=A0A4U8UPN1_STECR|nr:hypothetical protein L596_002409 [Steinernema carpocapsae]